MRESWISYFLEIAKLVATRSTCLRRQVGAVIVKDRQIISTGYNGAPSGIMSCMELGSCYREQNNIPSGEKHETCSAVHAEANAIVQAAKHGISVKGSTMYITHQPCSMCARLIVNSGIKHVYWEEGYPDENASKILCGAGIINGKIEKGDNCD